MFKSKLSWLFVVMVSLSLAACSGGGDGGTTLTPTPTPTPTPIATPPPTTIDPNAPIPAPPATTPVAPAQAQVLTGLFVDAPVEGLTYTSGAQTGATDAAGTFKFEKGGTVQFKVGNIILGQAPAKAVMTPVDLVQAVDATATVTDARVAQITQFLMTVNASATPTKMTILNGTATAALNEAAVDLSQAPVDVVAILGRIVPAKTAVTAAAATAHIQATLAALTAPAAKAGTFAAFDSAATPTLGLQMTAVSNLAGTAFDVTGTAASIQGDIWTITGTLGIDGSLTATGTGTGATPATSLMVITGASTSATQITASANFTLNNVPKQVPVVFEKAVAPAITGKLALAADPGVTILAPPTQIQHIAAGLSILVDGTVNGHIVEGVETGLPLAVSQGGRYAKLTGVVTSTGQVIAMGGLPGTSETFLSRSSTPAPAVVFMTGTAHADGTVSATVKGSGLTTPALTIPPLSFVAATNAFVGLYVGTHTEPKPVDPAVTSFAPTVAFGVNNDGSAHGWARFFKGLPKQPESDDLLDGTVTAGGVLGVPPAPVPFVIGNAAVPPGLMMTSDDGITAPAFPGSMSGTITAGSVTGNWATFAAALATGTFSATLLP